MEREGREKGNKKLSKKMFDVWGTEEKDLYFVYEWTSVVHALTSRWSMKIHVVTDNYLRLELFPDM